MLGQTLAIFWRAPGGKPILVVFCMLLASLAEMTGMGALVPLVGQLSTGTAQSSSILGRAVASIFQTLGIPQTFTSYLLAVGVFLILRASISFLAMWFVAISVADVGTRIREKLLHSMLSARWAYFVDHKPGEVAAGITAQSAAAGEAYSSVAMVITTAISAMGLLIAAMLVSMRLVIFCFIATAALALPLYYILRRARSSSDKQWQSSTDLTTGIQDFLSNMKPLKAMDRQERYVEAFLEGIKSLRETQIAMAINRRAIFHGQDILGMTMILSGVYVATQVLGIPISEMVVVGIIFYQLIDFIKHIQLHFQDATVASAAYYRVLETIKAGEGQREPDDGTVKPALAKAIRFEGVEFSHGERKILDLVTFDLPANRISVLIGPSGAGKTTLVDLIIGLHHPQVGKILVDGVDLSELHLADWRKLIGYVPQELTLLRGSVADNITLGDRIISDSEVEEALQLSGALAFVQALPQGLKTDIGTMGAKLSGGQRQRISLARALVHKPKLLLLDEVTSALDDATEAEICQNIAALGGKLTIVAITHKPAWTKIADKIYRVNKGKVLPARRGAHGI